MSQTAVRSITEIEDLYGAGTYHKRKLVIVRGQGARLWSQEGKEYIDCIGGQGAANIGHQNPYVNKALQEQSQKLINCTELFYNDQRALLLETLARLTPPRISRFFFCNSGAESIEGAFKFARLATGRTEIVATMRGYHGKSMGALSATWNKEYREPFEPLVPGFSHVPFDNLEKTCQAITEKTAAFIVEPVQGESGVRPGSRDYFQGVEAHCRKTGTLLILDEVQTGFCRTGKMFALGAFWHRARHPLPGEIAGRRRSHGRHRDQRGRIRQTFQAGTHLDFWRQSAGLRCGECCHPLHGRFSVGPARTGSRTGVHGGVAQD